MAPRELIDGVTITSLICGSDHRGDLHELLTTRDHAIEPIVHVYQIRCLPGSLRAWVYHKRQSDRLAFTAGRFIVVLYDIRPGSRTYGLLNEFELGEQNPALLLIPACVVHGVKNAGPEVASFVNMPTSAYDHDMPDKFRLPGDHPGIPYRF